MFQRLLVGADGSTQSEEAVRQAARISAVTGARLEVAHVVAPVGLGRTDSTTGARRLVAAEEILIEAQRIASKEDVEGEPRVLVGDPASELAREAAARWCDLVCVGPDAAPGRPFGIGAVALHLLHRAASSVLVARPPGEREGRRFPSRVLSAVDETERSLEAVRQGAAIAAAAGAGLRVVHVVSVARGHGVGWTADGVREGFEPLDEAVKVARSIGVEPSREMSLGRAGPAIADVAEEWDADLVVVGDTGTRPVERLLLGSVSEWVARHAGRSVLVARNPARPR